MPQGRGGEGQTRPGRSPEQCNPAGEEEESGKEGRALREEEEKGGKRILMTSCTAILLTLEGFRVPTAAFFSAIILSFIFICVRSSSCSWMLALGSSTPITVGERGRKGEREEGREGGRGRGRKGEREEGREGGRERGREGEREEGRGRGLEGGREGEKEGGRGRGREGKRNEVRLVKE